MAGPRYIADPPNAIRMVELDGLTALFHRPSGTTHILAPPAPQILVALHQGPASATTILSRIKEEFEIAGGRGRRAALAARLAELESAGLVREL
jgi:PqqD family protein of HPr-rel-A system